MNHFMSAGTSRKEYPDLGTGKFIYLTTIKLDIFMVLNTNFGVKRCKYHIVELIFAKKAIH